MPLNSRNAILALAASVIGHAAFAQAAPEAEPAQQCSEAVVKIVGDHFGLDSLDFPRKKYYPFVENAGLIVAGACKPSPTKKHEVISAFAYDAGVIGEKELLIAVVDQQALKVESSYSYTNSGMSPGGIGSLKIDAARYNLSSGLRAFGIDITPGYSHNCGDGGGGVERTLYVQEGRTLRSILHIPSMSFWRFIKGSHRGCGPESDVEIVEDSQLAIEVGTSETNGYRDIIISATSSRTDGKPVGNGKFRYKLRYNGQQYPIEEMEKAYFQWSQLGNHEP